MKKDTIEIEPLYVVRGHDNDLWNYDIVCVGSLPDCRQFVADSPYDFLEGYTFDRIEIAKHGLWRIGEMIEGLISDGDELHFHTEGWLKRIYPNADE